MLLVAAANVYGIVCEACPDAFHCEKRDPWITVIDWQRVYGSGHLVEYPDDRDIATYYCGWASGAPSSYSMHSAKIRVFWNVISENYSEDKVVRCDNTSPY